MVLQNSLSETMSAIDEDGISTTSGSPHPTNADFAVFWPHVEWNEMLENLSRCEYIVCSSLHCAIFADVLGTPHRWLQIPRSLTALSEGETKYLDYYASTGRAQEEVIPARSVHEALRMGAVPLPRLDLTKALLEAFPYHLFEKRSVKRSELRESPRVAAAALPKHTALIFDENRAHTYHSFQQHAYINNIVEYYGEPRPHTICMIFPLYSLDLPVGFTDKTPLEDFPVARFLSSLIETIHGHDEDAGDSKSDSTMDAISDNTSYSLFLYYAADDPVYTHAFVQNLIHVIALAMGMHSTSPILPRAMKMHGFGTSLTARSVALEAAVHFIFFKFERPEFFLVVTDSVAVESTSTSPSWLNELLQPLLANPIEANLGVSFLQDAAAPAGFPSGVFLFNAAKHLSFFEGTLFNGHSPSYPSLWLFDLYVKFNSSFVCRKYGRVRSYWSLKNLVDNTSTERAVDTDALTFFQLEQHVDSVQSARRYLARLLAMDAGNRNRGARYSHERLSYGEEGILYYFFCQIQAWCMYNASRSADLVEAMVGVTSNAYLKFISFVY